MKTRAIVALMMFVLLTVGPYPGPGRVQADVGYWEEELPTEYLRARVMDVQDFVEGEGLADEVGDFGGSPIESQLIRAEISRGPHKGTIIETISCKSGNPGYDMDIRPGDRVLLWAEVSDTHIVNVGVFSFDRSGGLKWLTGVFLALLLIIGGLAGAKTWLTLGITGLGIVYVLLPAYLMGYDPIPITVLGCMIIACVTFGIIGGINKKTLTAMIGTVGGVVVAGIAAMLAGMAVSLTGYGSEEAAMLSSVAYDVPFDLQRLLFAGMMIGALGAVMDVAMSVASSMEEVRLLQPNITTRQLVLSGLRVGRDIMGTMSNTLILAYTGGSVPLLLIFLAYRSPLIKIVSFDHIATEIVKALAGSIGLITAIPITAIVGSRLYTGGTMAPRRPSSTKG